jgi:hypothetical protein
MGVLARIEDTTKGILRATARDTAGDILKAIMLGKLDAKVLAVAATAVATTGLQNVMLSMNQDGGIGRVIDQLVDNMDRI